MLRRFWNRRRLVALGGVGLAVTLLVARQAEAQPAPRYAVKWSIGVGAQSCPQQTELTAAVARLVSAEQLTTTELAERVIFGRAEREQSWHATLTVVDVTGKALGEREIESEADSCMELAASVALAIALIIDPEHVAAPATQETAPDARRAPESPRSSTVRDVPPIVASAPPVSPPSSRQASVRVLDFSPPPRRALKGGAVLLSGVLPELAIGAQLEFWQPLVSLNSLRFALAYFGAQTRNVPGRSGASAKLYLVTARAAYCPLLAADPKVSVFGCAGLESGLMVGRGQGGGYDSTPVRGLLALDGALTVDWSLAGPWALSLTTGAAVTPLRPRFTYQTAEEAIEVYRRSPLEGRLEIGLAYRF
ncbi:MAG TPA: hypothetical protein VHM25_19100 [Polyangiaceae bacterium]|nr:hypothetical protein [Polyangiaceae bacterium]